jgi:hypothetical protein
VVGIKGTVRKDTNFIFLSWRETSYKAIVVMEIESGKGEEGEKVETQR